MLEQASRVTCVWLKTPNTSTPTTHRVQVAPAGARWHRIQLDAPPLLSPPPHTRARRPWQASGTLNGPEGVHIPAVDPEDIGRSGARVLADLGVGHEGKAYEISGPARCGAAVLGVR